VRRILGGIEVSTETIALEVIDQVGPDGNFLEQDHTLRHFRENWYPTLLNRTSYAAWQQAGGLTYGERASARVREILEGHRPEPLPAEARAAVQAIVRRADGG
jgi:trimethylamine--corrinoid protein Co-methyltransferase